jgi:hypothetical protein
MHLSFKRRKWLSKGLLHDRIGDLLVLLSAAGHGGFAYIERAAGATEAAAHHHKAGFRLAQIGEFRKSIARKQLAETLQPGGSEQRHPVLARARATFGAPGIFHGHGAYQSGHCKSSVTEN